MEISGLSSQSLLNSLAPATNTSSTTSNSADTSDSDNDSVAISEEAELLDQLESAMPSLISAETTTSLLGTLSGGDEGANSLLSLSNAQALAQAQAELSGGDAEQALASAPTATDNNQNLLSLLG